MLLTTLVGCWVLSEGDLREHDRRLAADGDGDTDVDTDTDTDTDTGTLDDDDGSAPPDPRACEIVHLRADTTFDVGVGAAALVTGDFDADAVPDLAWIDDGTVVLLRHDERRQWTTPTAWAAAPDRATTLAAAPIGEGRADLLLAADSAGAVWAQTDIESPPAVVFSARPDRWVAGPLDAGEAPDAVVVDGDVVTVWTATPSWEAAGSVELSGAVRSLALGDVDGDGLRDVVAATNTAVHVLGGDGVGGLTPRAEWPEVTVGVFVTDIDGDRVGDVVLDLGGAVEVRLASGGRGTADLVGAEVAGVRPLSPGACVSLVALAPDALEVFRGDGAGGFHPVHTAPLGDGREVVLADLDRDGFVDAAVLDGPELRLFHGGRPE